MRPLALSLATVAALLAGSDAKASFIVTETQMLAGLNGTANFAGAGANQYSLHQLYSVTTTEVVTVEGFVDFQAGANGAVISYRPGVSKILSFNGVNFGNQLDFGSASSVTLSSNELAHIPYTFTYTINSGFDPAASDIVNPFTLGNSFEDKFSFNAISGGATITSQGLTDANSEFTVTYTYLPAPPAAVMCLTALPGLLFLRRFTRR